MARSDSWMRRLVCASTPAGLLCFAVDCAGLVNGVLRIGAGLQLSPLYGDDLPGLSHRSGFSKVPRFNGSYHRPHCADVDFDALLVPGHPVDFYALPGLESLALQRTELRPVHDVRAARRRRSISRGPASVVLRISHLLSDPASELPHRPLE